MSVTSKIKLYIKIDNVFKELDVDENELSFNFTFDSLDNPTKFVNEYSYQFDIPKTPNNNKLFNNYNKFDSFNSFKMNVLYDFTCLSEGSYLTSGKLKIEAVTDTHYSISLKGYLYDMFNKLLSSGWSVDNEIYLPNYVSGVDYLAGSKITTTLAKNSFDFNINDYEWNFNVFKNLRTPEARFHQAAGLMPTNNIDMEGFSIDKVKFGNVISDLELGPTDEKERVTDITQEQMCEYRCYKLRPYIYVHRLWQLYQSVFKIITGYDLDLDSSWFNSNNNYLRNVVYTLPLLDTETVSNTNQYTERITESMTNDLTITSPNDVTSVNNSKATFEWTIPFKFNKQPNTNYMGNYYLNPNKYIKVVARVGEHTKTVIYKLEPDHYVSYEREGAEPGVTFNIVTPYDTVLALKSMCDEYITVYHDEITDSVYLNGSIEVTGIQNEHLELDVSIEDYEWDTYIGTEPLFIVINAIYLTIPSQSFYWNTEAIIDSTLTQYNGYESDISLSRLFADVSPFSVLLKYSKMMGLLWLINDSNNTIKVVQRSSHFISCLQEGYINLTDSADFSTYTITPLAWDSKSVVMNFDTGDEKYGKSYEELYGLTYGSVKINTNNNTNQSVVNLLCTNDNDKINPPIISAEFIRPIRSFNDGVEFKVQGDNYLVDSDNVFCYRVENSTYSSNIRNDYRVDTDGAYVVISGDTEFEKESNIFCWHAGNESIDKKCYSRPVFSESHNGSNLLFAQPYETYSKSSIKKRESFIYDRLWKDYFEEIYNENNKTLALDVVLNVNQYNKLKTNPLVVIGNILYFVVEVNNYNNGIANIKCREISDVSKLMSKRNTVNLVRPL